MHRFYIAHLLMFLNIFDIVALINNYVGFDFSISHLKLPMLTDQLQQNYQYVYSSNEKSTSSCTGTIELKISENFLKI